MHPHTALPSALIACALLGAPAHVHAAESEVEIINLYDAFGRTPAGAVQDFGFSALVRYRGKSILFDSGTSADTLERNARAMGVDLSQVDFAVASHAHLDHVGGFDYLLRVNPEIKIYMAHDVFGAGAPIDLPIVGKQPELASELPAHQRYFDGERDVAHIEGEGRFYKAVEYVNETRRIADGITLVATSSPFMGYFSKYPDVAAAGQPASAEGAKLIGLPELSLSLRTRRGEVLLVGCSHSTVEAIVAETRRVTGRAVRLVAGGYHLLPYDRGQLDRIIAQLKKLGVREVAPAHCTGHLAFQLLRKAYGRRYRFFGLGERLKL
jgi:7,8-dihydropterin-6-yl-methyl-4-(beta-D-ribofuranosyl)aminobenzene 5'-phosphate synthase